MCRFIFDSIYTAKKCDRKIITFSVSWNCHLWTFLRWFWLNVNSHWTRHKTKILFHVSQIFFLCCCRYIDISFACIEFGIYMKKTKTAVAKDKLWQIDENCRQLTLGHLQHMQSITLPLNGTKIAIDSATAVHCFTKKNCLIFFREGC